MKLRGMLMVCWVVGSFQPLLHNVKHRQWGVLYYMWCVLYSRRDGVYKRTFASEIVVHVVAISGFLSRYPSGPLPYVSYQITVNTMCYVRH